ncbi:uncharacterized protein LOC134193842 isoform X2 [Corticium candelabrum]|uniref:uncharacterized protein LOC134193842 isoform X2 n=1 Tax=Corticium candelabrum TaxID=121492 RepID=UPI002E262C62|nr:uncharacterized protein LOC134193842 isoform X2 [Corticium candelabrum]
MSFLLRELPSLAKGRLSKILDSAGDGQNWKALATVMGYSTVEIKHFELQLLRGRSPATEVLDNFGVRNYTTDVVWQLLANIGQQSGMQTIRDFVSPHLIANGVCRDSSSDSVENDGHFEMHGTNGYPTPPSSDSSYMSIKEEGDSVSERSSDLSSTGLEPVQHCESTSYSDSPHHLCRPPSPFSSSLVREFTYEELECATDGFNEESSQLASGRNCVMVGRGGYGKVFKGVHRGHRIPIAVKCLTKTNPSDVYFKSLAEVDIQTFAQEIVNLSRIRHPHIVTLLGYCRRGPYPLIVWEWMANGSLSDCLAMKARQSTVSLSCVKRVKVAHDIAKALLYLHTFPDNPMVHLNVKSSNILLDESYKAKLGDFGIARIPDVSEANSRTYLNTKSLYMAVTGIYLPPEYIRGKLSPALDVYAFGVVLLEIMTGQPTYDPRRETHDLTCYMSDFLDAIDGDPKLLLACRDSRCANWPDNSFVEFGKLANRCLDSRLKRPSTENIARELEMLFALIQPLEGMA